MAQLAPNLHEVRSPVKGDDCDGLIRVVAIGKRSGAVAQGREAPDIDAGGSNNAVLPDEIHPRHLQNTEPVLAGKAVLRPAALKPSLISKAELADDSWAENLSVGDRGV